MIERDFNGLYTLTCDLCGEEAFETFEEFHEAVQYKKDEGWKSQKHKGEWEDVCPECQEGKA
jgi:Fe2+ or Zn2+ uptake regulation protein